LRVRANQFSDLLARRFDRFLGGPPKGMIAARGVAGRVREGRQHRLHHAPRPPRPPGVIHVDGKGGRHKCVWQTAGFAAAGGGGSDASSAIVHSPSAVKIRSRTRQSGSRTLHFEYCSHCCPSSVEHAVTVTGPSIAWITSATEMCVAALAS